MDEDTKVVAGIGGLYVALIIFVVVALCAGSVITASTQGWFANQQYQAVKQGQSYTDSHTAAIQADITDFANLNREEVMYAGNVSIVQVDEAQQRHDVVDVWNQYDLLPSNRENEIAPEIKTFLTAHPRNWYGSLATAGNN